MGFYVNQGIKAKCPLYESIVRSPKGKVSGIQCSYIVPDPGLHASVVIRLRSMPETLAMKRTYCDDDCGYKKCPYYVAWNKMRKER